MLIWHRNQGKTMNEHYPRFAERTESELRQLISFFGKIRNRTHNQSLQFQAAQVAWCHKKLEQKATFAEISLQRANM